jgi:hypothetical protein
MASKSPTGFGICVTATAEVPELLLADHHLESFEDFEEEIDKDYSITATKASRRRQLGKQPTGRGNTLHRFTYLLTTHHRKQPCNY